MDKLQADAVAKPLLEPDLKFQEELRRRRAAGRRTIEAGTTGIVVIFRVQICPGGAEADDRVRGQGQEWHRRTAKRVVALTPN